MFLIRILAIALIIAYLVWLIGNRIFGKNFSLIKVVLTTLVVVGMIYTSLALLSYLIEGM